MFVGGVIVEDHVHQFACGHRRLDGIVEAYDLLMAMALHAAADDLSLHHVEGGEQRCGAVPLIVVRYGSAAAVLERQA
jgi:hypothetical protein